MTTVGVAKGADVTRREAEVLALLGQHFTNAQIADQLCISVRTVESHVSALLRKLELADRRSLARCHDAAAAERILPRRATVPLPVTSFVGRAAEQAALTRALAEQRMVTAIGPGGIGKSRLALSVASGIAPMRRGGAWFVDLVHVTDPTMVMTTVAETVGVPEQRRTSIDDALVASLAASDSLLVLDNCEHVLDGVRHCVELILASCPQVTVLATSRSRLVAPYEWVYAVPGLSVTEDGGDAVALFSARVAAATGVTERLDARRVAALCRALDGIALAIELAAARSSTVGLDGLEAGLDERLRFLTGGARAADRHRSLRDAISWSYDLLTPGDRALLRAVAVFASWFDVDAADAVVGAGCGRAAIADGLARLADNSLLVVERGEPTRYRMLETIRQYGLEQLAAAGESGAVRDRHEQWCRAVIAGLTAGEHDDAWCARFDRVVDDVRAGLLWSARDERRHEPAAQLAADLAGALFLRGRLMEAQRRYEQAADLALSSPGRARHLRQAAGAAASRYVGNDTLRLLAAAADLAVESGDHGSAAFDLAWMSIYIERSPGIIADMPGPLDTAALRAQAHALSDGAARAEAAIAVADVAACGPSMAHDGRRGHRTILEQARRAVDVAHRAGDAVLESAALDELCAAHLALDDIPAAARTVRRRGDVVGDLAVGASTGFELFDCHLMASEVALAAGDLPAAGTHADGLCALAFLHDEDHLALRVRLMVDALAGNFSDVARRGEHFRLAWERAGRPSAFGLARAAHAVAMVHGMLGEHQRRAEWLDITVKLGVSRELLDGCSTGWAPTFDAMLALHRDDPVGAADRLRADLDDQHVWGFWNTGMWRPWYAALWAEAGVLADHPDAASRLARSRDAARDNPIATTIVERAKAIATRDRRAVERGAANFAQLGCPYQQARSLTIAASLRSPPSHTAHGQTE